MDTAKTKRLTEAGWKTGSVAEFLELTPEESGLIEIKLRLSELVKKARIRGRLSQDSARRAAWRDQRHDRQRATGNG